MYNRNMTITYPILIEKTDDGYYAECPFVQGVYTQSDTHEGAIKNLEEVMQMTLQDMKEKNEPISSTYNHSSLMISSLTLNI